MDQLRRELLDRPLPARCTSVARPRHWQCICATIATRSISAAANALPAYKLRARSSG